MLKACFAVVAVIWRYILLLCVFDVTSYSVYLTAACCHRSVFLSSVDDFLWVGSFDPHPLTHLSQYRISFKCFDHIHLQILHLSSMLCFAMLPKVWVFILFDHFFYVLIAPFVSTYSCWFIIFVAILVNKARFLTGCTASNLISFWHIVFRHFARDTPFHFIGF